MSDIAKVRKFLDYAEQIEDLVGMDNMRNVAASIKRLTKELAEAEQAIEDFVRISQTSDRGEAKERFKALMRRSKAERLDLAEKYNLNTHFLKGVGDRWDKVGDGREILKIHASVEKKINQQRKMVSEAYTNMLELVETQATEAGYNQEQLQNEIESWSDAMAEDFHTLSATDFWLFYKGTRLNIELKTSEIVRKVYLSEAKHYCEPYYPVLLLSEAFADDKQLGEVESDTLERWGQMYTRTMSMPPDDRERGRKRLAAQVLAVVVYRWANGAKGWPVEEMNSLLQLTTLSEDQTHDVDFSIQDGTQMNELVSEFVQLTVQA